MKGINICKRLSVELEDTNCKPWAPRGQRVLKLLMQIEFTFFNSRAKTRQLRKFTLSDVPGASGKTNLIVHRKQKL